MYFNDIQPDNSSGISNSDLTNAGSNKVYFIGNSAGVYGDDIATYS